MKYLISKCESNIYLDSGEALCPGVKYIIDESSFRIIHNNKLYVINIDNCDLITSVSYGNDKYYFLEISMSNFFTTNFSFTNKIITVSMLEELIVTIDGEVILRENVDGLHYSHFEKVGEMCLIYFDGHRNYVVAIKKSELLFASYFDEYNEDDNDKYFLCRLSDSLNHGRVFRIGKEYSSYLVYLDDEDMCLDSEFTSEVFLDCIIAGNYKYANNMLDEGIRQIDGSSLKDFFPTFDYFYPVDHDLVILMKKNTLAGIFRFELNNQTISNIIEMK